MQKGVITLVKSAITGEKYPLPEGFNIDEAYKFIMKHKIMMLAYEGAVRCGISKTEPAMQKLFQSYVQGMLRSEKQMKSVNEIYSAFEENEIDYLPLKGCNMKALYPKPELRLMGDADILIKEEQYKKIKIVLSGKNFIEERESMHHYLWYAGDFLIELHTMLIPETYQKLKNYYGKGWQKAQKTETNRYVFSKEDEFIFIIAHFAKHYLGGGIGIRHVTDIFVYLSKIPDMDFKYIEKELEKLGVFKFYKNVLRLIDFWFEEGSSDETIEEISDFILKSGNWGNFESHVFANGATSGKSSQKIKGSKLKFFIQRAFPPAKNIKDRYKILKKAPFLLPLIWPIRFVDAFIFRNKNFMQSAKELETMDDEMAEIYRQKFEKAGFDF